MQIFQQNCNVDAAYDRWRLCFPFPSSNVSHWENGWAGSHSHQKWIAFTLANFPSRKSKASLQEKRICSCAKWKDVWDIAPPWQISSNTHVHIHHCSIITLSLSSLMSTISHLAKKIRAYHFKKYFLNRLMYTAVIFHIAILLLGVFIYFKRGKKKQQCVKLAIDFGPVFSCSIVKSLSASSRLQCANTAPEHNSL